MDDRDVRREDAYTQDAPGFTAAEHNETSVLATCDGYLRQFEPAPGDSPAILATKSALVARFVAKELPADFVAQLRADRDLYGPISSAQESKRRGKVEDTQAVEDGLAEAGKQIRYLNAIMHNKFTRNPESCAAGPAPPTSSAIPRRRKPAAPAPAAPTARPHNPER